MGGGDWNGCAEVNDASCQYNAYPCLGEGDTDLTKARYKYVAYTISRMYLTPPSSILTDEKGCGTNSVERNPSVLYHLVRLNGHYHEPSCGQYLKYDQSD